MEAHSRTKQTDSEIWHENIRRVKIGQDLLPFPDQAVGEADGSYSPNSNISIRGQKGGLNNALRYETSTRPLQDLYSEAPLGVAARFNWYMESFQEPHKIRDVAEVCESKLSDPTFMQHLWRAKNVYKTVKALSNDYIQWINTDYKAFLVDPEVAKRPSLGLKLPFGAESLIYVPEKAQIVVAGDGGGGKTHWGYTIADLNLRKLPIRHFIVEDGDQRMVRLLEDYPLLADAFREKNEDYQLINPSKGQGLEPSDNLNPEGLNVYDYFRVPDRKDWYLAVQKEMIKCSDVMTTGVVAIMIQKKKGENLGYGKEFTKMQCDAAFSMWIDKNVRMTETDYGYKQCHITIEKAREPSSRQMPEVMACGYRTAPLHGKLVPDTQGWIMRENFEKDAKNTQ